MEASSSLHINPPSLSPQQRHRQGRCIHKPLSGKADEKVWGFFFFFLPLPLPPLILLSRERKLQAAERLLILSVEKLRTALKTCGSDLFVQYKLAESLSELLHVMHEQQARKEECAVTVQELQNSLTSLIAKLEKILPTEILPKARRIYSRFLRLQLSMIMDSSEKGFADGSELFLPIWNQCKDAIDNALAVGIDVVPFAIEWANGLHLFFTSWLPLYRKLNGRLLAQVLTTTHAQLMECLTVLYPHSKKGNTKAALWCWWLLATHARHLNEEKEQFGLVPAHVISEMVADASECLELAVNSMSIASSKLLKKLLNLSSLEGASVLFQYVRSRPVFGVIEPELASSFQITLRSAAVVNGTGIALSLSATTHPITSIDFTDSTGISDLQLVEMLSADSVSSTLVDLALPKCESFGAFINLSRSLGTLKKLVARGTSIEDKSMSAISRVSPVLEHVDASYTKVFSPITWVTESFQFLDVSFCGSFMEEIYKAVVITTRLTFLGIGGFSACAGDLFSLRSMLPSLKEVDLNGCGMTFGNWDALYKSRALSLLDVAGICLPEAGAYFPLHGMPDLVFFFFSNNFFFFSETVAFFPCRG